MGQYLEVDTSLAPANFHILQTLISLFSSLLQGKEGGRRNSVCWGVWGGVGGVEGNVRCDGGCGSEPGLNQPCDSSSQGEL